MHRRGRLKNIAGDLVYRSRLFREFFYSVPRGEELKTYAGDDSIDSYSF